MSAIALTNAERIAALGRLGYTDREAAFLLVVALQGGYFLRRQYWDFIGQESGSAAAALVERLRANRHAVAHTALNQTRIYHLSSRPFFSAIGESDNRNRREHSSPYIKTRLMGLDFVLAHPNHQYLATEHEKVEYFSGDLGVSIQALPARNYLSLNGAPATTRYFVDKYPIFLTDTNSNGSRARVCFCFVDEGMTTLSGFETYVEQYAALWRHLADFEVIYVADTSALFAAVERRFSVLQNRMNGSVNATKRRLATRLVQYFEARALFEKGEMDSFSKEKLIQLRNDGEEFSGPEHQTLYERWKRDGAQAVRDQLSPKIEASTSLEASFSTYLLGYCYGLTEGV